MDNTPELAHHFKVQGIPTLVLIPMEGEPIVKVGAMPKEGIVGFQTGYSVSDYCSWGE